MSAMKKVRLCLDIETVPVSCNKEYTPIFRDITLLKTKGEKPYFYPHYQVTNSGTAQKNSK